MSDAPRRVVVAGARGHFGAAVGRLLDRLQVPWSAASRRPGAPVRMDVEDPLSLRAALRPGDVVVDAAGPFQDRSTTLVEVAAAIGFDVVDLSDSLSYSARVLAMDERLRDAGVRVLTACSSVSVVAAALVQTARVGRPRKVLGLLAPATRRTANKGTAASLLASVGRPVHVLRDGQLTGSTGWAERRRLRLPGSLGTRTGRLFESADAVMLPESFADLEEVALYVTSQVGGLDLVLDLAARVPLLRALIARLMPMGLGLARWFGSEASFLAYQVEGDAGVCRQALVAPRDGELVAAAPAALAARALARGDLAAPGVVPPHLQVPGEAVLDFLRALGMRHLREVEVPE